MTSELVLWPILVQIALTVGVYARLLVVKRRAYATKVVDRARVRVDPSAWPDFVKVVNNNLVNQFHVPVLFYVVSLALAQLDAVDVWVLVVAWLFVLSRVAHAFVHMGSNYVPHRLRLFSVGLLMVLLLALRVAWALLANAYLHAWPG